MILKKLFLNEYALITIFALLVTLWAYSLATIIVSLVSNVIKLFTLK